MSALEINNHTLRDANPYGMIKENAMRGVVWKYVKLSKI